MSIEAQSSTESERAFQEAKDLFGQEKYDDSLQIFSTLVNQNPQSAEYLAWLGRTHKAKGDPKTAFELAEKAIKIDNKLALAYFVRGMVNSEQNRLPDAISDLTRSIELDPNFENAYIWRGDTLFTQKKYREAIKDYSKAIELNPKKGAAYQSRANSYFEIGEDKKAVKDLINAYNIEPKEFFARDNDPQIAVWARIANKHLRETLLPQLKESGEHFIESFITILDWGKKTEVRVYNGSSYHYTDGTRGAGYICLTDKNIYIFTFGELSKIIPKANLLQQAFLLWARYYDSTKIAEKDMEIKIPFSSIEGINLERSGENTTLKLVSTELTSTIYAPDKTLLKILEMGRQGKLDNVLQEEQGSNDEIFALINKLATLKEAGVITIEDFESKKKELLARL